MTSGAGRWPDTLAATHASGTATISPAIFLFVLTGAALHAGWNAIVKLRLEPLLAVTLINISAGLIGLPLLLFTGLPASASYGWSALSLVIHMAYTFALAGAYARADMGVVYPIARGGAPLLTAGVSLFLLGEPVSVQAACGIAMLGAGIIVMTLRFGKDAPHVARSGIGFALLTAVLICCYTLSDGLGARASGNALAYSALLFVLNGFVPLPLLFLLRGRDALAPLRGFLLPGFVGGAMGFASYAIAIWAMTQAPIALVAAVRETSVLFGAAIAVGFLGEPLRWNRILAALMILAGLMLIRLG